MAIDTNAIADAVHREAKARAERERRGRDAGGTWHGKKNIYVCGVCHGHIVTVDRDPGVTPFIILCKATENCRGEMHSSMYRVFDQSIGADHEWYRPDGVDGLSAQEIAHVDRGGLLLRRLACQEVRP
jgi:hypothetical protein